MTTGSQTGMHCVLPLVTAGDKPNDYDDGNVNAPVDLPRCRTIVKLA